MCLLRGGGGTQRKRVQKSRVLSQPCVCERETEYVWMRVCVRVGARERDRGDREKVHAGFARCLSPACVCERVCVRVRVCVCVWEIDREREASKGKCTHVASRALSHDLLWE